MAGLTPEQFVPKGLSKQAALAPVAMHVSVGSRIHQLRLQDHTEQEKAKTRASQSKQHPRRSPSAARWHSSSGTGQGGSSPGNEKRLILVFLCKLAALFKGSRKR